MKKIDKLEWSKKQASFVMARNTQNIERLILALQGIVKIQLSKELKVRDARTLQLLLSQSYNRENTVLCPISYLNKMLALDYSISTIHNYYNYFITFVNYFKMHDIDQLKRNDIESYINQIGATKNVSPQYIQACISAIKFYYEKVLRRNKEKYELTRPKMAIKLPNVMSEQEVTKLLKASENIKHQCILLLIYSAGLRIGEVINIKLSDLQDDRNLLFIRGGKGKKDRYTIFADKIRPVFSTYIDEHKPKLWLFEGQYGYRYSLSSIYKIFEQAKERAGIVRKVTPHSLRHSFASHLIEQGVDIKIIQELLGHASLKTTEIYSHVVMRKLSNIKSPLDKLEF